MVMSFSRLSTGFPRIGHSDFLHELSHENASRNVKRLFPEVNFTTHVTRLVTFISRNIL